MHTVVTATVHAEQVYRGVLVRVVRLAPTHRVRAAVVVLHVRRGPAAHLTAAGAPFVYLGDHRGRDA